MPEPLNVPLTLGVPELVIVAEGVAEPVGVSDGVPEPLKVPEIEEVPELVTVTEGVPEPLSV